MLRFWMACLSLVTLAVVVLLPMPATAQTGTIAGAVTDETGGVLPGVTVEARSPALIEQVRTAVSDGSGGYRIVDLRLGEYSVTFTLAGFNTFERTGIALRAGTTVNVNAELEVGQLQETITVSGLSPQVDIQNTKQLRAVTRQEMDALPTGRQWGNYAVTIPGAVVNQQDVGGTGIGLTVTNLISIHGTDANDMPLLMNGMRYGNIHGTGAGNAGYVSAQQRHDRGDHHHVGGYHGRIRRRRHGAQPHSEAGQQHVYHLAVRDVLGRGFSGG